MALYEVSRTDDVLPGEFASALVVAAGTSLARKQFAGRDGATGKNLVARKVDTTAGAGHTPVVLTTLLADEAEPEPTLW
ncbi:hypothetical protein [Streptomyces sp. NBC_01180]|uniref:hypothetical protein n=1 Tax=Streptomyces sp. NBC_01180 TaxID=2903763 RepID=UPI00386BA6F2|nr:hypothetical protein OG708_08990 [Streptomyces sp. NBC_01180]